MDEDEEADVTDDEVDGSSVDDIVDDEGALVSLIYNLLDRQCR